MRDAKNGKTDAIQGMAGSPKSPQKVREADWVSLIRLEGAQPCWLLPASPLASRLCESLVPVVFSLL